MEQTMTVSEKALIGRINRRLRDADEVLNTARSERVEQNTGRFYVLDVSSNCITEQERRADDAA
jgi:hypothetical protein